MSRSLRLATRFACSLTFVTCTASTSPKPPDPQPTLSTWFALWVDARTCLVAPAENLDRGVEIAMERRRDCSPLLQRLDIDVPLASATQEQLFLVARPLSRMIDRAVSSSNRAAIIDDLDKTVAELERLAREGE